jgi:hypothetical protein
MTSVPTIRHRLAIELVAGAVLALVGASCAPRLAALPGEVAPAILPRGEIAPGRHQLTFNWEFADPDLNGHGEGVARIATPDSLRLDFFIAGGFISGGAVLIGDSLETPGPEMTRRLVPPPTMLWAALGRSALPVTRDTAIGRDGALLRADLGRPVAWRVTYRGDTLVRLEHVEGGRVVEWIDRSSANDVEYRQQSARRSLKLHITRVEDVTAFDASIWHIDR